ncbi:MAG: zinc-finger domain-containing protein [Coxiella endosymbiont of Dermacentor nuttalli]
MVKCEKLQFAGHRYYEITQSDLPLSCPMPRYHLWDAHPRVYLPIKQEGYFVCPYCEVKYILKDFK